MTRYLSKSPAWYQHRLLQTALLLNFFIIKAPRVCCVTWKAKLIKFWSTPQPHTWFAGLELHSRAWTKGLGTLHLQSSIRDGLRSTWLRWTGQVVLDSPSRLVQSTWFASAGNLIKIHELLWSSNHILNQWGYFFKTWDCPNAGEPYSNAQLTIPCG